MQNTLSAAAAVQARVSQPSYVLKVTTLSNAGDDLKAAWKAHRERTNAQNPMLDPDWLSGYFEGQTDKLLVYSLYTDGVFNGVAIFLKKPWPLALYLGEITIAELPLERMKLLGGSVDFPEDDAAYDLLFRDLTGVNGTTFDALFLEEVPVDSFLWKYLERSPLVRQHFRRYEPGAPTARPILRFEGTFAQYMGKFNAKHRNTLSRKIKKLRESPFGEMRLERFQQPSEVAAFLDPAVELSKKTYQWQLHGRGLKLTELIRKRLTFAAQNGWMRCYLLYCGDRVCAFLLGFQYRGTFLLDELGFDPELGKYSPGTVLQMLVVEDLFTHDRPRIFDLQDYGAYKEALSTESHMQGKLFLFRRSTHTLAVLYADRSLRWVTNTVSSLLDRLHLKTQLKQRLRGFKS